MTLVLSWSHRLLGVFWVVVTGEIKQIKLTYSVLNLYLINLGVCDSTVLLSDTLSENETFL